MLFDIKKIKHKFTFLVDSGKTGFVVDKKRIDQIRAKYGQKYPDFLGKDKKRSYRSESIVGQLYRNAHDYINGEIDKLEEIFAQLNLDDNEQEISIHHNSVKPKRLFFSKYF